ncbi:MAG: hypothetical protein HC844_17205 [Tabrizicola sp.]|nr:hypothetical protein [Tabrizicola sp.]
MLRLLIGLGVLMMLAGFGAAGWQFVQSRQPGEPDAVVAADAGQGDAAAQARKSEQTWLISPTGGLVPQREALAYLSQDRFVEGRTIEVTRTALLTDLLLDGEKLPDAPYLEVLADIRAPIIAEKTCAILIERLAAECALNSARVVEGSVDAVGERARFRIQLVYRLKETDAAIPDPAVHALNTERLEIAVDQQSDIAASAEDFLRLAIDSALQSCTEGKKAGLGCRVTQMDVTWYETGVGAARAEIGWLAPLPKGIIPVKPLG